VLVNLLSNAVKYNGDWGQVLIASQQRPEGRLRLMVTDSGPGIAPELLAHLFVPFERLGAERGSVEGTGIGLALSRRLAEAMGGTLGVASAVGQGSTFWVELPLAEGPVARFQDDFQAVAAAADEDTGESPSCTVLYIEGNLSNLELVQRLVARRRRVRLLSAMQGRLGLQLAREQAPDLVLLDVHLPDIPGDTVLQQLQADPATAGIPVVMVSADATPGRVERLLAAGAREYLTKPLDVVRLLQVVDGQPGRDRRQVRLRRLDLGTVPNGAVEPQEGLLHEVLGLADAADHVVVSHDEAGRHRVTPAEPATGVTASPAISSAVVNTAKGDGHEDLCRRGDRSAGPPAGAAAGRRRAPGGRDDPLHPQGRGAARGRGRADRRRRARPGRRAAGGPAGPARGGGAPAHRPGRDDQPA
jgi:CheY-like chemotaxis protein